MTFYTNVASSGDKILLRQHDSKLNRSTRRRVEFNPVLFMPELSDSIVNSPYKNIYGKSLKKIEFDGIKEYWEFKKRYSESGAEFYGDISPITQYISESYSGDVQYLYEKLKIANLDIEVYSPDEFPHPEEAKHPINAISLYDTNDNIMYTWGLEHENCGSWDKSKGEYAESRYAHVYRPFTSEYALLSDFLKHWEKNFPDIITGWFTDGFDIPYIINRLERILGEGESRRLSPWKQIREKQARGMKSSEGYKTIYQILGVASLDYLVQYKKYSYTPQESYKLDQIAYDELKIKKLSYDEVRDLAELYRTNYQKFIDYNIRDVDIVQMLDDKKGFLKLVVSLAYYAKINFDDVASPVRIWDSLIYNYLRKDGIQIPADKFSSKKEKYQGAYVKHPHQGRYSWIVSVDLASEYPSLMRGINISPDTFVPNWGQDKFMTIANPPSIQQLLNKEMKFDMLQNSNMTMAANGTCYQKDKEGFLPALLTKLFAERKANKKEMLKFQAQAENSEGREREQFKKDAELAHVRQYAKKILLNSAYGALGNEYFRFFDVRLAEAITVSGQLAIQWAEKAVNKYLNNALGTEDEDYVIYIDTDSIYINCGSIVEKFMPIESSKDSIVDKLDTFFSKKIIPMISKSYDDLAAYLNHREQLMIMDREVIADSSVWCSKKHYFMTVRDSEGIRYKKPKTVIKGLGFIKSNIPEFCRDYCTKVMVPIGLTGDNIEFSKAIDAFEIEFMKQPPETIACVTGVTKIEKYKQGAGYILGTPIGSKSSIIYNNLHAKHNLGNSYPLATEGNKIRYLWLKRINPIGEDTVGFIDYLPPEFHLEEYIDWNKMFEKAFIGPINEILIAMDWNRKVVSALDSWF